jgi:prepilin-type N-terminal cleavage/methylation domain-containing protein
LLRCRNKQNGFTLIEAAIVLVIVGLLLGAVLQGRQLIESARFKSLKSDLGEYREAFDTFQQRYNAVPGDYADADTRLGMAASSTGDGNGVIDTGGTLGCDTVDEEECLAWRHLRAARLIRGDAGLTGTDAPPEHAFQGTVSGFFTGSQGNGEFGHKLLVLDVPARFANQLDDDLDDGDPDVGLISCNSGCSGGVWPANDEALVDVIYAF